MSPAPQPPRPNPPGKPGKQPEKHPAERGAPPGPPQRPPGRFVEVRKGKSGTHDVPKDDDEAPIMNVALPRSITQEQEQADLKQRLGREELIDIDKRNSLVKVKDSAAEPSFARKGSNGLWLLLLVVIIATGAIVADKMHLFDSLKKPKTEQK
jgi:hypothetical protein